MGTQKQLYPPHCGRCSAGKLVPDYGPQRKPGYLPKAAADDLQQLPAVPNLPAKSGTREMLPPARLQPGSCCPPPIAEPLVPMNPDASVIVAERQAERIQDPALLINRLVYDSLEPPMTTLDSNGDVPLGNSGGGSGCSSSVSSSRTTRSTGSARTSNSDSTLRDDLNGSAAPAVQTAVAISELYQYAPELSCWYVPQVSCLPLGWGVRTCSVVRHMRQCGLRSLEVTSLNWRNYHAMHAVAAAS